MNDTPWYEQGVCRTRSAPTEDTDPFFHPEGERGSAKEQRISAAKDICATCPVMAQCRDYALAKGETFGIWGGMSEDERAALRAGGSGGAGRWLHVEPFRFAGTKVERIFQPEVVLGHLNQLADAGFTVTAIGRVAGVHPETVRGLLTGTNKQLYRATAEKLLSVHVREAMAA